MWRNPAGFFFGKIIIRGAMRDCSTGSVMHAMKVCLFLAIAMFAPFGHAVACARPMGHDELPIGSSLAFRDRMLGWSAHGKSEAALPVPAAASEPPGAPVLRLSSVFGYRMNPVLRRRMVHSGIDIPGPVGTPVHASDSGMVRLAGVAGGFGQMVEIAHSGDLVTRYAHLSRILVGPGAQVAQGDLIGLMGSTGRSTGSHLHFEIRVGGKAVDPLPLLRAHARHPEIHPVSRLWLANAREPHISRFAKSRDFPQGRGLGF